MGNGTGYYMRIFDFYISLDLKSKQIKYSKTKFAEFFWPKQVRLHFLEH